MTKEEMKQEIEKYHNVLTMVFKSWDNAVVTIGAMTVHSQKSEGVCFVVTVIPTGETK